MPLHEAMAGAVSSWLIEAGGQLATYYTRTGSTQLTVVLEKDVETVTSNGNYVRQTIASIASGIITCPATGDYFILASGGRYRVDLLVDDPGHIMRLAVSKV
jgi:hypothetical protein